MFLKFSSKVRVHKHTSRNGKTYSRKRKARFAHLKCDGCKKTFQRQVGNEISIHRCSSFVSHFCNKCPAQALAACKAHITQRQQNAKRVGLKMITSHGYISVYVGATYVSRNVRSGSIFEHIYMMEQHLGRELQKGEVVHHIDGNKQNNGVENLDVLTVKQHNECHAKTEQIIFDLVKEGVITYNRRTKRYERVSFSA